MFCLHIFCICSFQLPNCYCCYLEINKTSQHTRINNKHLQSSNVYAKVTLLLQYTHP